MTNGPNILFGKKTDIVMGYNGTGDDILPGKAVNVFDVSGELYIRLANNALMSTECHGFAKQLIADNEWGPIRISGKVETLTGSSPGTWYFLGTDGNIVTPAPLPPFGEDNIVQIVGFSVSATTLQIKIEQPHGINLLGPP